MSTMSASAVICFTYMVEQKWFQTIDCSKQIPDLLTAVYNISKGNPWTIGKSNVLCVCVFLRLGWIWRENVKIESFAFLIHRKEVGAQRDEKDKCYIIFKKNDHQ